jgi:hypothetical protein
MLLNINTKTRSAEKCRTEKLNTFGLDERGLQDILFKTLDRLFPDDELILLMQSRRWQEEPDLMAIDKNGDLFIFELKAWESDISNLLQVLRYGQMYGASKYEELNKWYEKMSNQSQSLKEAYKAKFGTELPEEQFNRRQVFVVMTNGLDSHTREAIRYWRSSGLDIRPWVYRVYTNPAASKTMYLEISAFRVQDNPYEDIAEGYYILNTNFSNNPKAHADMLANAKAAAYYDPWKFKIERLEPRDVVFLYKSGAGIVAVGEADGKLNKCSYQGNPDEEYFKKLQRFQCLSRPLSAAEIKTITGINHVFMGTMFGLDADSGKKIRKFLCDNGLIQG